MVPTTILLFSGKRKCGKDFLTDYMVSHIGKNNCEILKISEPIKSHWAKTLNLDLSKLLDNTEYKETHRFEMIKWSEGMRAKDSGCFCRAACESAVPKNIWIVSDIRRKTDLKWFREAYGDKIKTVRVTADDNCRRSRGWNFVNGVDDAESECDLDDITDWDFVIENNNSNVSADVLLKEVFAYIQPFYS